MSNYQVIRAVSQALRDILWEAIESDEETSPIVGSSDNVVFSNPTETAQHQDKRLSLWLYQVTENEFLKNQPPLRTSDNGQQLTPLALNLYYLVTPFARDGESDQLLLGRIMQAMYDNAVVLLQRDVVPIYEELRVVLCRLTLEELTRIWEALREPYRLSVCYQVRVTRVESLRTTGNARVLRRDAAFGEVPAVPEVAGINGL